MNSYLFFYDFIESHDSFKFECDARDLTSAIAKFSEHLLSLPNFSFGSIHTPRLYKKNGIYEFFNQDNVSFFLSCIRNDKGALSYD